MRRRHRNDAGQATLEAALSLPIVLIALLLIVQVGIVVRDVLALQQAAREGVRAAAVLGDDDRAEDATRRSAGPLDGERIEIRISPSAGERRTGDAVLVDLRYVDRLSIPIVSRIVSLDLPLRATATMRAERGVANGS
jgi:uncharacterized membrane protein